MKNSMREAKNWHFSKNLRLSVILSLFFFTAQAQVILESTSKDLGTLNAGDLFYADIEIENVGENKVFILRADEDKFTEVKFSNKSLSPGAKEFVRIQYNPKAIGPFKQEIKLYLSNVQEPVSISIHGDVLSFKPDYDPACPDFSQNKQAQKITVKVFVGDDLSSKPLASATVKVTKKGQEPEEYFTSKYGFARIELPIGIYQWEVNAAEYQLESKEQYVNRLNKELNFYLKREEGKSEISELKKSIRDTIELALGRKSFAPDTIVEEKEEEALPNEVLISSEFPVSKYAANNLVFLIDVSESMRLSGKIHLLRKCLSEVFSKLRSIDKVAIIVYSDEASVLLPSSFVRDPAEMQKLVKSLEAKGKTNATKGLDMAYEIIYQNFIQGGNNQIFLSSDGVYSKKDTEASVKLVRANYGKSVQVSTIGIKAEKSNLSKLKKVARYGQGRSINLLEEDQGSKALLKEIQRNSRK